MKHGSETDFKRFIKRNNIGVPEIVLKSDWKFRLSYFSTYTALLQPFVQESYDSLSVDPS